MRSRRPPTEEELRARRCAVSGCSGEAQRQIPVCRQCWLHASTIEQFQFHTSIKRAVFAADVQAAVRAARARLVMMIQRR